MKPLARRALALGGTLLARPPSSPSAGVVVAGASNSHDYEFNSLHQKTYGVDVSFPYHHHRVSTNYDWLPHNDPAKASPSHPNYAPPPEELAEMPVQRLGHRQDFYDTFLEGCR